MTFIESLSIPAIIVTIFFLLIFIAATLKNIEMHTTYKNMILDEIKEDIHKIYFAERIKLKKDYGVNIEDLYDKYRKSYDQKEIDIVLGKKNEDLIRQDFIDKVDQSFQ